MVVRGKKIFVSLFLQRVSKFSPFADKGVTVSSKVRVSRRLKGNTEKVRLLHIKQFGKSFQPILLFECAEDSNTEHLVLQYYPN
jgi:hypothetical protein